MFGNLPKEWRKALPPAKITSTWLCFLLYPSFVTGLLRNYYQSPYYDHICGLDVGSWLWLLEDQDLESVTLSDWLCETYFDENKRTYFSRADVAAVGALLHQIMQYRPSDRPQASELLHHDLFQQNPFQLRDFRIQDSGSSPQSQGPDQGWREKGL